MVITMKLQLYKPNQEKEQKLIDFISTQHSCVNWWIDRIRELESTRLTELQKYYYKARNKFGLSAVNTQLAMFVAIRLARTFKRHPKETPYIKSYIGSLNDLKIDKGNLGVLIGDGRTWIPFKSQKIPQGKLKESKIKKVGKKWFCYLSVEIDEPKTRNFKRTMGVDLGISKIAVTSDWNGRNTVFYRGEPLRRKRQHYYQLRKELQSKGKYRTLRKIRKKESNWVTDINHKISRDIVNRAVSQKRSIAVENLSGIRKRIKGTRKARRMLHAWSFRQLVSFIEYKARLAGVAVSAVDPRETSRTCPKCQYISRSNRKSQERFKCKQCRYESNADRVASMNIAQRATGLLASPIVSGQKATAPTSA